MTLAMKEIWFSKFGLVFVLFCFPVAEIDTSQAPIIIIEYQFQMDSILKYFHCDRRHFSGFLKVELLSVSCLID